MDTGTTPASPRPTAVTVVMHAAAGLQEGAEAEVCARAELKRGKLFMLSLKPRRS